MPSARRLTCRVMSPVPRRHVLRRTVSASALVAVLAGCASAVSVPRGEYAMDPACGSVLQWLPETLGEAERRSITSQATAAWGDPAITLRCGITPPAPTTDRCITVQAGELEIDWIVLEDGEIPEYAQRAQGGWVFQSYGRVPAVEVVVPAEQAGDQVTSLLVELAPAMDRTEEQRACVGVTDVY